MAQGSSRRTPPPPAQYGIGDLANDTLATCGAGAARAACIDFALGAFIVQGTWPYLLADSVYAVRVEAASHSVCTQCAPSDARKLAAAQPEGGVGG